MRKFALDSRAQVPQREVWNVWRHAFHQETIGQQDRLEETHLWLPVLPCTSTSLPSTKKLRSNYSLKYKALSISTAATIQNDIMLLRDNIALESRTYIYYYPDDTIKMEMMRSLLMIMYRFTGERSVIVLCAWTGLPIS